MKSRSRLLVSISLCEIFFFFQIIPETYQATIGDGTKSLYTGNVLNLNETRGSCVADGVRYLSETAIPRDHPCHYCICYQSQVTCYWKQCAAPPTNCEVMEFQNVCNPSLYVCGIPQKTIPEPEFGSRLSSRRLSRKRIRKRKIGSASGRRTASYRVRRDLAGMMPVEEEFPVQLFEKAWRDVVKRSLHSRHRRAIDSYEGGNRLRGDTSCTVFGVKYNLGEVIGVASEVCMECRCAAGVMFCSPKCCFLPSPFSFGSSGGNALFIKAPSSREVIRPPHPLHSVRNQFEESPFRRK